MIFIIYHHIYHIITIKQEKKHLLKKILLAKINKAWRLPWWLSGKESTC